MIARGITTSKSGDFGRRLRGRGAVNFCLHEMTLGCANKTKIRPDINPYWATGERRLYVARAG